MKFIGWMYDIAREQSPRADLTDAMLERSLEAGYNAVGLYLEHRFEYASAPWAASEDVLSAARAGELSRKWPARGLRIIPFLNTLGHMEGFIHSEGGQWLSEGRARSSLQMCPTRRECIDFARGLVADAMACFDDEWVHLGGDETRQLGQCPLCAERAAGIGPAGIYAEYFGGLCRWVLERGRRPCLWGDMLLQHPEALGAIPRQTLLFDWQYEHRPAESTQRLRAAGFDVVCCPSVQSYNSAWCFLDQTQRNVDEHAEDARAFGALGVLVTTWECSFFSQYAGILPIVHAAGRRLSRRISWDEAICESAGEAYLRAASILGNEIPRASSFLGPGTWRPLRDRLVIRQNPFELWLDWRDEACGGAGDAVLALCDEAVSASGSDPRLAPAIALHRAAVEFVRRVEDARGAYRGSDFDRATRALSAAGAALANLRPHLERAAIEGGSTSDCHRLRALEGCVDRVIKRLRAIEASPYRPAFELLTHPAWVPGDQAAWRVNSLR